MSSALASATPGRWRIRAQPWGRDMAAIGGLIETTGGDRRMRSGSGGAGRRRGRRLEQVVLRP